TALHLAQHAHDLGFGKSCLLHRNLLVHPAEKILLPHPLKIGGITPLRMDMRALKERLAVLNQAHFGNSSERTLEADADLDLGFAGDQPDEAEEQEEEVRAKGKQPRKIPKDIEVIPVDHYPEDMTCRTYGGQKKSIKAEERVGSFRMVPEHVVLVKNIYHTCACNRGRCKENKPMAAKSKNHIMRGRGIEASLVIEAASQKYFEGTATYRMERRLINCNINLTRQTIGRNLCHVANFLEPVCDEMLRYAKMGSVVHMDETPLRIQASGTGRSDTGYLWAICRDERHWNPNAPPLRMLQVCANPVGRSCGAAAGGIENRVHPD
ncbi:IS66 family transposase, partial [Thalassospira povalilytica]|uniref:IS66 family transposase n=1 Tax=Thalassospira povalilytica TaxID=732237 RepID=UPI003AA87DAE